MAAIVTAPPAGSARATWAARCLVRQLSDAAGNPIIPTILVAFTSFDIGQSLYNQYQQAVQNHTALPVMNLAIKAIVKPNTDD